MSTIYGVAPSPFVRKVMLAHAYKAMSYEFVHTLPSSEDTEFRQISPLGKVPAYKTDNGVGFSDSSVIIAYIERVSSSNALYPENAEHYALALWFEEYADTKMMETTGALYFQRIIGPKFFGHEVDQTRVTDLVDNLIPAVLDFIEGKLSENNYLIGDSLSIADLSVGANLINLLHADFAINAERWPKLAAYNKRFLALDIVKEQINTEVSMFNSAS